MKKYSRLFVTVLALVLFAGIFSTVSFAASDDYTALPIKRTQLTVGHYADLSMTGEIVQHCANPKYNEEIACLVDNKNSNAYWSKAYKFSALKDNGGTTVPVILIDVANGGEGVTVSGFDMMLRKYFDCQILHFELQATVEPNSDNWVSVLDKKLTYEDWVDRKLRFEFPEVTVYKFRFLAYDIGDADISNDSGTYETLLGDETRFALSEIDLLQKKEGSSGSDTGNTTPTTGGSQTATSRPVISFPTTSGGQTATQAPTQKPTSQPATQAPTTGGSQGATQAPTQKPTSQPATLAPTTGGSQSATQAPTQKPTTNGGQTTTVAPTVAPTVDPSAPTVDPSAPTVEPTVDPSAPTVDPSAPTESTPVEPTEAAPTEPMDITTVPATAPATQPEATNPITNDSGEEKPNNTWIIIVAIVAAAAVAGGAAFFIIKKKRG